MQWLSVSRTWIAKPSALVANVVFFIKIFANNFEDKKTPLILTGGSNLTFEKKLAWIALLHQFLVFSKTVMKITEKITIVTGKIWRCGANDVICKC